MVGGDGIADSLGARCWAAGRVGRGRGCGGRVFGGGCRLGSVYLFICFDVEFVLWCWVEGRMRGERRQGGGEESR